MIPLELQTAGTSFGQSLEALTSPASTHGGETANRLRAGPGFLPAQFGIDRLVRVMGLTPENFLIGFELSDAVAGQWGRLEKAIRRCRREFSGAGVHDVRVCCRRLIARLVLIDSALPSSNWHSPQKSLKHLLNSLGRLRDVQVQRLALAEELPRHPEAGGLWLELGRRERALVRSASRSIAEFKLGEMRRRLEAMQADLKNPAARLAAKAVLGDSLLGAAQQAFEEVAQRARASMPGDLSTFHRVRIAFKQFRYLVEALPATLGRPSETQLSDMNRYQQALGNIQDARVLLEFLTDYAARSPAVAWSLASFREVLLERRRRAVQDFMAQAATLHSFWPLAA